ncbi:MAG TPA: hypothetical protein VNA30_04190, partial [Mycobacteriales bacterium]|nr:hypothetical protein [Mycobacteriales bacterium]
MNVKRFGRGPFLYILLALLAVLAISSGFSGDGGFKKTDTSTVLAAIQDGEVRSSEKDPALLLDKEQQVKVQLEGTKKIGGSNKLSANFLFDQGGQFVEAFEQADVRYDVKVSRTNPIVSILIGLLPILLIVGLLFFFMNQMQSGGRVMQFGKSKAKLVSKDTPK